MIWFRSPRVNLDRVLQSYHQELDALVFDDFEVNGTLQVAYVDPAIATLDLLLQK